MSIKGAIKDVSKMDDILTPKEVEKKYSWGHTQRGEEDARSA